VDALAAAPAGTDAKVVWTQAQRLGTLASPLLKVGSARDLWMRVSGFLEQEELAAPLRIDLEHSTLDLQPGPMFRAAPGFAGPILCGLVEGIAAGRELGLPRFKATAIPNGVRLQHA
jgi:hypothetical protein